MRFYTVFGRIRNTVTVTMSLSAPPLLAGLCAHHQLGEEEEARAHRAPKGQDDVAPPDPGPLLGGVEGSGLHGHVGHTRRVRLTKLCVVPGSSLHLEVRYHLV